MLRKPITLLLSTTLISLASLVTIIKQFEPCNSYSATSFCGSVNSGSITFLQTNLFLFTLSLFTLILYLLKLINRNPQSNIIKGSFRQSFLLSILIQFAMTSSVFGILYYWNLTLVACILFTIEVIARK